MQPNNSALLLLAPIIPLTRRYHAAELVAPETLRAPLQPKRFAEVPLPRMPGPPRPKER